MELEQFSSHVWKSPPPSENLCGSFDCNICFDSAREPVVTLCGHLYCWPCIYKWLSVQTSSISSEEQPQCPVCKADIHHGEMIPLYGRGQSTETEVSGRIPRGTEIPPRPAACGGGTAASNRVASGHYLPPYRGNDNFVFDSPPVFNGGPSLGGIQHPVVGMFGETVFARVFGNSQSVYPYGGSHRLRRQDMHADKSLNRISIFLFCCVLLCLLVF